MTADYLSGTVGTFLAIFLLLLVVLWILMPFAIFGTKARLDRLIALAERREKLLIDLIAASRGPDSESPTTSSSTTPGKHLRFRD